MSKALTNDQIKSYRENGFVFPLGPAFNDSQMEEIRSGLEELIKLLEPGESTKEIREWHEAGRFLYDICMNDVFLDHVEDLIGPDFYLWASNFFIKDPGKGDTVAWHQDAYYWPMDPVESATVWLAVDDVDESNGAMLFIPGSHKTGFIEHERLGDGDSVLGLGIPTDKLERSKAVSVNLSAGEFSIHDDKLIHGSPRNSSSRRRAGLTIRYSPTRVKNDMKINPHFRTYLCRGDDCYGHNPVGTVPTQRFGRLYREHSSKDEYGNENDTRASM